VRVFFFGSFDWANTRHKWCRALRHAGVDAEIGVLHPHPYGYDETVMSLDALAARLRALAPGDVAFYTGCGMEPARIEWLIRNEVPEGVLRATSVSGSFHRNALRHARQRPWPFGRARIRWHRRLFQLFVCLPDLFSQWPLLPKAVMLHGVEGAPRMAPAVRFAYHCPSRRETKGTALIESVPGIEVLDQASWRDYQHTRSLYAVCVDQLAPEIGGLGANAEEALALGQIVVADVHNCQWADLAPPPILQVDDRDGLRSAIQMLQSAPELVATLRARSLAYAAAHLQPESVASRLRGILECATRRGGDKCRESA